MNMNRRRFLTAGAIGTAASVLPLSALSKVVAAATEISWSAAFKDALEQRPWLAGFKSVASDSFQSRAEVRGQWPADLKGTLFRNGPARHEIGDFRYHHWFDGDGMLHGYRMSGEGVTHTAQMIQTHKYKAEKAAGRALYPAFATVPPNPSAVTSADVTNPGNISVLPHHGKLLALWEAGSAWEIDAETLDTKGIYSFSEETAGVPFSAHPRVEPDGTLWNFGYVSSANLIVLWHVDKNGQVVKMGKIVSDPISMPHDFIVTAKHIVLMMPPLNYQRRESSSFLDSHEWQPSLPTRILVVDKNDFSNFHWVELPSQWVFHFGNGWEDSSGVIRFDGARGPDPANMLTTFRDVMRGDVLANNPSHHHQYRIDTKTWRVEEQQIFAPNIHTEFPVIDPRVSCRQNKRLIMMSADDNSLPVHVNLNRVSTFDIESGKFSSYRYDDSQIPEEHLFIPKPGSDVETAGWIVGTAHDWKRQLTLLNVFNVDAVDAGPIATATLPYSMPLGLHGKFVAS
ncbi:MAG: carotenoid oxygenase family protein [Oceanicoccus sp.]